MDAKDSFVFFVLLLLSLGLFGSLSLTYCVWNKQTEVASELADVQNELQELMNERKNTNNLHLEVSDPSQSKGQLKRNVRQAEDTDTSGTLANVLTEVKRMKLLLNPYMNCSTNEYNHTKCTLKPGPKGEPGPEGEKGEPGDMGQRGEPGDMGQRGEPGDKGVKGNPGNKGEEGKEGLEGSQGPPGPTGPQGPPGIQGKDGVKGEQGLVGSKGNTGPQGSQGPTGARGEKGGMGERGLKGDMGPPGPQGETGERGDMGEKGEPGSKGTKGNLGYPGYKGNTGSKGTKGNTGFTGYKGQKGEQGAAGPPGPQGPPGLPAPAPTTATPEQCGGGQWRRVVFLNMTDSSHVCPSGLANTTYSRRTCGRAYSGGITCSSTTFSVGNSNYSRVCGRALAYQFGLTIGFYGYHWSRRGIEHQYVDGLSLTHGAPGSRQHIWTFASGIHTGNHSSRYRHNQCPCDNGNSYRSPPFVGNDYFCESLQTTWTYSQRIFLPNALLWDGQVCEGGGTCCKFNNPPWFTKNLTSPTTEDIELRLCLLHPSYWSNIALEQLELYVQ